MSLRNSHPARKPRQIIGRRLQARRSHALFEALEKRQLLSGYTFTLANQGSGAANGTYLQALINGSTTITGDGVTNHVITLGDTLILPDGYDYDMGVNPLYLPNLGAAATVSETGGVIQNTAHMAFNGGGYTSAPTVVFMDTTGSGAIGTATLGTGTAAGTVTGITITNGGSNYSTNVTIALIGGAQTLTIESSGYAAGDLGSTTTRFNPATDVPYDAQISGSAAGNGSVVATELSDAYNHSGAAQNYTFDGIEVGLDSATDYVSSGLVNVGSGNPVQDYNALVPYNFTFNQDYVHGGALGETSDDLTTAALNDVIDSGIELNSNYCTVENSQISDVHSPENGAETHGIICFNGLGNFIINNNYIEAAGEGFFSGGVKCYLPSPDEMANVTITNNFFTKNPAWNPALPQFAGVAQSVKNEIELKQGTDITISQNILQNAWVGADQRGQAINISNIDNGKLNPWMGVSDVMITDNVFRNVGMIVDIASGAGDGTYNGGSNGDGGNTELTNNITIENNLAYDIGGTPWSSDSGGGDDAIWMTSQASGPIQNVTIENNTIIGTDGILYLEDPQGLTNPVVANLVVENNVLDEGPYGIDSSAADTDIGTLNSVEISAFTITNPGSNYTAAPTVTISGGGATGTNVATATAYIWQGTATTGAPFPLEGQIMYIQLNLDPGTGPGTGKPAAYGGSGYTANPTVTISGGGGSGATATAIAESDGQIHGYTLTNNVIIGASQSNYPPTNATTINYFPASENAVQMLDPAGDEYGLLSTSPYYTDGTSGSTPGVNMAALTPGGSTEWAPSDSTNSLQNYYKFNEGSGSTAHDNGLGTHENGTLNGTYTWNTTGPEGGGISFSGGSSGDVSVANFTADSSFTFAAWIKPTNFSAAQYIASTNNSSSVSAFSLSINTSGQLVATGTTGSVTAGSLTAGQWSLVSVTYSSGTLTLYVNGAQVGSTTSASTTTGTTTLYIGGNKGSVSSFNGTLDEVRYYSTSLAQTMSVIGNTNLGLAGGFSYSTSTNGTAVTFTGGGGSGAAATAYAEDTGGAITSILVTNNGSGYTAAPTMSFGSTGSNAAVTAVMSITPLSYLYAQYGPQFEETDANEAPIIKGTTATLYTDALSPDEKYSAVTYTWTCVVSPAGYKSPQLSGANDADVLFYGVGRYLFECVATNSLGQSTTQFLPVNVVPVANTNVVFISPANPSVAEKATQTFTVNGTSIASLGNNLTDEFDNPMPSSGWAWSVSEAQYGTITTTAGLYTAPNTAWGEISDCIILAYTTPDGISYTESTGGVDVTDASVPSAPATITVTSGASNSNVIAWTAPTGGGETGYYVYADTNPPYGGSVIFTDTNTSTLSFTDTTETPGTAVYYYVEAYNANGGGADTAELGIVTGAPVAPTNLVATGGFSNSVSLTWTNSATNATGVEVWRSTDDVNFVQIASLSGAATSFIDNATNDPGNPPFGAPVDGTTYYYEVMTSNTYTSLPAVSLGATPIGPPTGLKAMAISDNQISVSWNDPSSVPGYYLQYENADGGSWTTSTIAAGNTSYIVTTGLSADTQYNFEIEAYDAAGNSGWSSPISARTWNAAATPTVYEGFNYSTGSATNVIGQSGGLGWSAGWAKNSTDTGANDQAYQVISGSASVTPTSAFSGSTNAANFLLTTGNSFYSQNNGGAERTLAQTMGASGTTVWASVLVQDGSSAPGGFVELIGNNTSGGTNNVEFGMPAGSGNLGVLVPGINNWGSTAPVQNNTYLCVLEIQYDTSGSDSTLTMYIDPDPTQASSSWTSYVSVTPAAVLNNIDSVEIFGSGSGITKENQWDEVRIGTNAASVVPTTLPAAPTDLTPTPGTSSIALSWDSASSFTSFVKGYDIWRSTTSATSGFSLDATVGSSTLSYTDSSVTPGTTYYYEVTAENATGDSLNSAVVSAATNGKPPTPTGLAATPGTNSITLTWNSDTGQTSYTIQRSTDDATWSSLVTGVSSSATSYTDTTPTAGTTYYYQIEAVNGAGDSGFDTIGLTGGAATVHAREEFNYPTASTWTGANTTGIGFTGNWTVANSSHASIVSGLTYNSGTSALTTSGNALQLYDNDTATQTLNQSVGAAGSTLWVSYEFNSNYQGPTLQIGTGGGTSGGDVNFEWAGAIFQATINTSAGNTYQPSVSGVSPTAGTTYFIVAEIQYLSTSPVISMWVDPTPNSANGGTPTGAIGSLVKTIPSTGGTLSSTTALSLSTSTGTNCTAIFDEVRLGSTYASVAPDPQVAGSTASGKKSSHGHRKNLFLAAASSDRLDVVTQIPNAGAYHFYPGGGTWQFNDNNADNVLLGSASGIDGWHGLFN